MIATIGECISPTRCAAGNTSTVGAWPNYTQKKRPTASANSKPGARCLIALRTEGFFSAISGGHRYPRLAHVGDRTGLEMIRTLQDHGIHQGIEVHMEHTIVTLLKQGQRVVGAFGYERERGRFKVFKAKAIVLATGGIGRAYRITSNSWEYTGDGQSLAYHAGAELVDMEYVQFHPTGMIWPPSVMGILVTEGVRGEGGVLCNKDGQRFMFSEIPENYKPQTADNPEEGWRYTQGDKNARRRRNF